MIGTFVQTSFTGFYLIICYLTVFEFHNMKVRQIIENYENKVRGISSGIANRDMSINPKAPTELLPARHCRGPCLGDAWLAGQHRPNTGYEPK